MQTHPILFDDFFKTTISSHPITVIAPASGTSLENIEALKKLPLSLNLPETLQIPDFGYHANSDEIRFNLLKEALYESPPHSIIWALRGGYGSARLLKKLSLLAPPKDEKYVIGSSDITALHLFLSEHWGWKTIHGAGLLNLLDETQNAMNFLSIAALIEQKTNDNNIFLTPWNDAAKTFQTEKPCHLTGGNLTLLTTSMGTFWQPETHGKIIFLEDVNEKGYRIDRALHHLVQARFFEDASAIILGDFICPEDENMLLHALSVFANSMSKPVFKTNLFGHGKNNIALRYQTPYEIVEIKGEVNLRVKEPIFRSA